MSEVDLNILALFAFYFAGIGAIAWWATTLDRPKKPHHPAPGE
jgi:hypothetical protein